MKRGFGAAIVLSASLALAGCNSPKPNPILNKTPAAETIMADAGLKEVKKPESKLAAVPAKVSEEPPKPAVSPIPENPYEKREPQGAKKGDAYGAGYTHMKVEGVGPSEYDPFKDKRSWYDVDKDGKRIYPEKRDEK